MITDPTSKSVNNAQWYSNGDVPDPPLFTVPGHKILIRPAAPPERTSKGGIIIPDQTREVQGFTRAHGRVLAVGVDAYRDEERFPSGPWCKVGDNVLYARHIGAKLIYGGVHLLILNDDEIVGVDVRSDLLFD